MIEMIFHIAIVVLIVFVTAAWVLVGSGPACARCVPSLLCLWWWVPLAVSLWGVGPMWDVSVVLVVVLGVWLQVTSCILSLLEVVDLMCEFINPDEEFLFHIGSFFSEFGCIILMLLHCDTRVLQCVHRLAPIVLVVVHSVVGFFSVLLHLFRQ